MPITNAQINDTINKLEQRVGKLENRMDENDGAIKQMKNSIDALNITIGSARMIIVGVSAVVGPLITALIVLIIQHFWK